MTLLESLEAGKHAAKIQRKHGRWRIAVYRGRYLVAVYEARELRAACALAVGSRLPTGTV
jgi:hypothetical protein